MKRGRVFKRRTKMMSKNYEQIVYERMCASCPNSKYCHEECETCENFDNEVEKERKKHRRKSSQLTHQEKMQIYNEVKSCQFYKTEISAKFNISEYTLNKVVKEIQELIDYKIKGIPPKRPKTCNICGGKVILNRCNKYKSKSGFVYFCTQCRAWVSTDPRNPMNALGELGGVQTRLKRRELHTWFDKLWKNHSERSYYYDRLAAYLGKSECHFSQMSDEELDKSLAIVKKWWFEKFDR